MRHVLACVLALSGCASMPTLRAIPAISFAPSDVLLTVRIPDNRLTEDMYCPRVVWEFGDDTVSVRESDCDPYIPGTTIEQRYSTRHCYKGPGDYSILVSFWRGSRRVLVIPGNVQLMWSPVGRRC